MQLGLIGLGKMGANMRQRIRNAGHEVIGYDPRPEVTDVPSLEALAQSLAAPRTLWVMVPAGDITRETVRKLADILEPGDLVIDGGNSRYTDDQVNAELLSSKGIGYLDCGVSGGVWGLENGYGLMVGGSDADVERAMPIFDALRPEGEREDGFAHSGPVGAGHYAKMIHNGIEYGLMQAYGEGYDLLEAEPLIENVAGTLRAWSKGTVVRSWLLDLLVKALEEDPGLQEITGYTEDSGEGRWTVEEAIRHSVPAPVIAAALFARFQSRQDDSDTMKAVSALRNQFGGHAVRRADGPGPTAPLYVRRLTLHDFRSWDDVTVDLEPGVSVFVGRNGFGKTNLVEALNYLATLGSHRVATDQPLIRVGAESASVAATVHNAGRELTAEIDIVAGRANKARINTAPCRRPRELLGILQSVLFAPEDLALVRGEPGGRRRFLDDLAILRTPRIAAEKADYERVLKQRTALLKTAYAAARRGGPDADSMLSTLDVWDEQLARFGAEVLAARLEVVSSLAPHLTVAYAALAPHSRAATVAYTSSLFEGFDGDPATASVAELEQLLRSGLAAARQREIERGVCLVGPHRDDLDLRLGNEPAKGFASHGESWSYALALRLASLELLRAGGSEPVLLLDDVFAELDAKRRTALAEVAAGTEQVIVTAAVPEDLPPALRAATFQVTVDGPADARVSRLAEAESGGPGPSPAV